MLLSATAAHDARDTALCGTTQAGSMFSTELGAVGRGCRTNVVAL
jgi:hypothetical protein